ncbi:hypothetical protein O3M35_002229 [Rhynocoris fuscipes]|uniref:Uncharacterized protein n=1 Tax=Rhynocoris fuscipes TaxID=488301 RepID=A0AAW1CQE2_9HEMI
MDSCEKIMGNSSDDSYVFKHFKDFDINVDEKLTELQREFERKEIHLKNDLEPNLCSLNECRKFFEDFNPNISDINTKLASKKADLESKKMTLNELKIKSEILEKKLCEMDLKISQNEIDDLIKEVVQGETEKTQKIEELKHRRDLILSRLLYYKKFLDCYLGFTEPDLYTFYFNQIKQDSSLPDKWIKLRTDDFDYWEFVDASISPEQKQEVCKMLEDSETIQRVICRVRNIVKNI